MNDLQQAARNGFRSELYCDITFDVQPAREPRRHGDGGAVTVTSAAAGTDTNGRGVSLELIGLSRRFGPVVALDGLTFSVPPGQVFGFLGPNGAGKTTAMRAIFGVVALEAGEVRWQGEPVTEQARRRFGYMPEERGLYSSMQILEQLEYLGRLHDMTAFSARGAAQNWIKRLGLAGRESAKLEALSHGNQQRVQLAAALIHDPELLVLDEPFAGLDPGGVDDMTEILTERARAGVTVVFSSHQLDLVEHICESVAIIHRGRVVAQGAVSALERGERPRRPGRGGHRLDGAHRGDDLRTVDPAHRLAGPAAPGARPRRSRLGWPGGQAAMGRAVRRRRVRVVDASQSVRGGGTGRAAARPGTRPGRRGGP